MIAVLPKDADKNQTVETMNEELPLTTPLQEFLAKLQQTMDQPPNEAGPVRGERERLIGILALLTRLISRVSTSARLRKTVNPFLIDQIRHLRQLNEGIQSPLYKAKIRAGSPADRYEIWNARRYVVAALECYLLAKPNVKHDDEIRKMVQKNPCLKRLIRHATTETRSRNIQLQSAIKRWRKSFKEGTAPKDVQESWDRDNRCMSAKDYSPSGWMAAGNKLLENACDRARRIILPPPRGGLLGKCIKPAANPLILGIFLRTLIAGFRSPKPVRFWLLGSAWVGTQEQHANE